MKILSVTAQKPDSTGSGVYLSELVKGFKKMGHEQAVIAGVTKEDLVQMPEDVTVYPVYYKTEHLPFAVCGMSDEMPYESTRYCDMTEEMTRQYRAAYLQVIQKAVEEFQPDVILCHHLYYVTALVREICPTIKVYGISHGTDLRQMQKHSWQKDYIKEYIKQLDYIFALHDGQIEFLEEQYECDRQKIKVIGTGYNSSVFYMSKYQTGYQTEKTRLIFAGKISEKKGIMSFLRAMKYVSNANDRFTIALAGGYGNEKEYLEIQELAEKCVCNVEFLGKLTQSKLAEELNQSDVFVLPSFYEGLPLVLIEAMACGLKVVCTDLPGVQPWLNANIPENGVVFVTPPEMKNADEPVGESLPAFERRLAEGIEKVIFAELPSQETVQKISWDGLCEKLVKYFEK